MSVAPKSKVSARSIALSKSANNSTGSQTRAKPNRLETFLPSDREQPSTVRKQQAIEQPTGSVTRRNGKMQAKRINKLNDQKIEILPESETLPAWLRAAIAFQQGSSIVSLLLVGAVLVLYGTTVYSQQLWSQKYRDLETLRRQERQLTAAGEVLKNQLANQAEKAENGLVSPSTENNLFLEPSAVREPSLEPKPAPKQNPNPNLTPTPVGY